MKKLMFLLKNFYIFLIIGLIFSACAKQESLTSDSALAGVYNLVSVDGKKIPADITHEGTTIGIRSGSFTIEAGGKCKSKTVFVPPSGNEIIREVNATYTIDGSKLTMRWENAGMTEGTLEGNTFTMNNEGMVLLYKK